MDSYLMHHGILGMKWGVRRTPEQLGHKVSEAKNRIVRSSGSRNSETLKKARKEDISKLTNQQLKEYNERLNLEQNFARLTEGKVGAAKKWITSTVITGVVVGAASQLAVGAAKNWMSNTFFPDMGKIPLDFIKDSFR